MKTKSIILAMTVMLALSSITVAQIRTGAIQGKVTDEQSGVMPGVTVTLSGEKVIGASTTVTLEDGSYRFRALEPGTYDLLFELVGFASFSREGILIAGARTITVDVIMQVAGVAETITVTGESPLIDVKQTIVGATFDEIKQDIPGATDTWALLGQTPGVRMEGFDVGGSHKSQQSGYNSFGISSQNQVVIEGVITTEGTGGTNWYFDYYATEEVRISASSGADVEMESPGAAYVSVIKSGGDNFSSLVNYDVTKEGMVGENLDEATVAQGYTGNQSNYYIPEAAGSHDFKIGAMHRYENHFEGASARSGPVYYYDDADGNPVEVCLSFPISQFTHDVRVKILSVDCNSSEVWKIVCIGKRPADPV